MNLYDSNAPRVSVIIPTFNHAQYIGQAITSVLDQHYVDYEIIVVDDGSMDNTHNIVAQFGRRVNYIWQENRGLAGARNAGIRVAKGQFIALLDSDDMYEQDFLSVLVALMDEHPDVDAVYCVAQSVDANNNTMPQQIGKVVSPTKLYDTLLKGGFFPPSCLFARRYCYMADGHLFDESLRRAEDLDLWLKFAKRYTIVGTDRVLLRYRIVPQSLSSDPGLVLQYRLSIIQRHFGETTNYKDKLDRLHDALGRSYVAAAIEYLQWEDEANALNQLLHAFKIAPELLDDISVYYELGLGNQARGRRGDLSSLNLSESARVLLDLANQISAASCIQRQLQGRRRTLYANVYLALGILHYNSRHFRAARRFLLKSLKANPRYLGDWNLLSRLVKSLFPPYAVEHFKKLRSLTMSH